jgi:prepilin-type processing-associated H-X9-DG protein
MRPNAFTGLEGTKRHFCSSRAFTRNDLAAGVAVLFLGATVVLPLLANTGSRAEQAGCLNNLRQIGIAFQGWGTDHQDRRPWDVPLNDGGTHSHLLRDSVFIHYTPLSNYLSAACLMDPAEITAIKRRAENWSSEAGGLQSGGFANNAVSYMIGPDTFVSETHVILAADRNVTFYERQFCGSGGGIQVIALNHPYTRWTDGNHGAAGNVLMNDGHVEFTTSRRLSEILRTANLNGGVEHLLSPF